MVNETDHWTILKLGGSLLSPYPQVNPTADPSKYNLPFAFKYAAKLSACLQELQDAGTLNKVAIIVGGGYLNKEYLDATNDFIAEHLHLTKPVSYNLQDRLGIAALTMNAHTFLPIITASTPENTVYADVIKYRDFDHLAELSLHQKIKFVVIAAHKPGQSSDMSAVLLGRFFKTKSIISLKNIDGVYDKNPSEDPQANRFDKLSWLEYKQILAGKEHVPRSHFPIDIVTTKVAAQEKFVVTIMDGSDLDNFRNYCQQKDFVGTVIS